MAQVEHSLAGDETMHEALCKLAVISDLARGDLVAAPTWHTEALADLGIIDITKDELKVGADRVT